MIGCLTIAGAASLSLQQLRIGGAAYQAIVAGKDLVADVLPPPLYVIEAYLEANLLAENPAGLPDARQKFANLRKDFNERRTFWSTAELPAAMR
ncbi:MAG: Methyl-accepting chemotaxis protein, partial [Hyphomicrobiales bacterium]|nr:Methyl-accepting chemotaxis protein [Hyphomicrobiales bacterium]